jgi:hypothetical protein
MERRVSVWLETGLAAMALAVGVLGCTTTKRAAQLVIDHHLGMARGAIDILNGKAEEREQHLAQLQSDLAANNATLASEADQGRQLELLREHVALQDALIAELMQSGHGHDMGAHQHSGASGDGAAAEPQPH